MINKRAHVVEVWCTLISLNFYLFQNNFVSLRGPKWVLFRLKKFLLEALCWLTAPRKYPSVIFCCQDSRSKKSEHQISHKITMAVWRLGMVCLLMIFLYLLSETVKKCDNNKVCVLRWQWLAVHFKIETLYPVVCLKGGERGSCLGPPLFGVPPFRWYAHKFSLFLMKNLLFIHIICYKADH